MISYILTLLGMFMLSLGLVRVAWMICEIYEEGVFWIEPSSIVFFAISILCFALAALYDETEEYEEPRIEITETEEPVYLFIDTGNYNDLRN